MPNDNDNDGVPDELSPRDSLFDIRELTRQIPVAHGQQCGVARADLQYDAVVFDRRAASAQQTHRPHTLGGQRFREDLTRREVTAARICLSVSTAIRFDPESAIKIDPPAIYRLTGDGKDSQRGGWINDYPLRSANSHCA